MMKNMLFGILLALILILPTGCNDELELIPPSSATTVVFYKTENDFLQALNAVYSSLMTYPTRVLDLSETRSDNIYGTSDDGKRYWDDINNFSPSLASNAKIASAWSSNYNGIFKANILLEQLSKNGSAAMDQTKKARLEAEAKFLRAFFYFDLVRLFGKVPLVSEVLTSGESENVPRSDVKDVYSLIIEDLNYASEHLLDNYGAKDAGRATKYAAKGILALVYMTRSGESYGIDGPGLGLNEWSQAAGLLDEIIQSKKYSFSTTYEEIFSYDNENNPEVIFNVEYVSGGLGLGGEYPSLFLPDQYVQQIAGFAGGVMVRPPSSELITSYEDGDSRKEFSFQFGYTDGGRYDPRPMLVKFVNAAKKGTRWTDWPLNFIVMRYTDILLLRAECALHGAPGEIDVLEIVNDVRKRANIDEVTAVDLSVLLSERRREFIGEGLRWHDLVRSGQLVDVMNAWILKEDTKKVIQPVKAAFVVYPVPQSEINIVPGLYDQNEGYN